MSATFDVVHGNPSDTELAVVISLLTAAASSTPPPAADEGISNWARPVMRVTLPAGPGAWWRSGLPQP